MEPYYRFVDFIEIVSAVDGVKYRMSYTTTETVDRVINKSILSTFFNTTVHWNVLEHLKVPQLLQ